MHLCSASLPSVLTLHPVQNNLPEGIVRSLGDRSRERGRHFERYFGESYGSKACHQKFLLSHGLNWSSFTSEGGDKGGVSCVFDVRHKNNDQQDSVDVWGTCSQFRCRNLQIV